MRERPRVDIRDLPKYLSNGLLVIDGLCKAISKYVIIGGIALVAVAGSAGFIAGKYCEKRKAVDYLNGEMQRLDREEDKGIVKRIIDSY